MGTIEITTDPTTNAKLTGLRGVNQISEKAGITPEGGFAVLMTNKTGANTVSGKLVEASTF